MDNFELFLFMQLLFLLHVANFDFHIVDVEWDSAYLRQDILLSLLSNQVTSL